MITIPLPNLFGNLDNPIQDFLDNFDSKWGIFTSTGQPLTGFSLSLIGATQSTHSFRFASQANVSNFPVEGGSFATYNKVQLPNNPSVILTLTGLESDRTQFLNSIDAAKNSTDLYSIITPEIQYINYTIQNYNYSRAAQSGTTLLIVELFLLEVLEVSLQSSDSQITDGTSASSSSSVNGGKVQGQQVDNHVKNSINGSLGR